MKKWLAGLSFISVMSATMPVALADEGLWPPHRASHLALYPVSADMQSTDANTQDHRWDIKSSVQVSREALRDAYMASRNAYTQKLQKYAKCSPKDAEKAIAAEHPGMKIEELQLRNIRTSLVYMAVASDDEDKYLVVVDAGNAKVLMDKPLPTHHSRVFAEH